MGSDAGFGTLLVLVLSVILGFIVGMIGAHVNPLRHLFTPSQQMRDEVLLRSRQVFFDSRVHHTAGRTGILIYVSLFERMAVVLADDAVVEKLGQATLDEMRDRLTSSLRTQSLAEAICGTIAAAAPKLRRFCPGPRAT